MKFIKKWFSMINKRDLVTSVTASIIVLSLIACGGGMLPVLPGINNGKPVVHLSTSVRPGTRVFPGSGNKPFLASMFNMVFATTTTPSQLAQSYDAVCNFQSAGPGFLTSVPAGSLVPLAMAGENSSCNFFSGPQGDGKQTIFDGQISSLVVTGKTLSGATFQCRDITNTATIPDNSLTRSYLDPNAHTVVVFNTVQGGSPTKVPFTCSGIGSDADQVSTMEAQWAKI